MKIFQNYSDYIYSNELYFIFIFNWGENERVKEQLFPEYIKESLKGIIEKKDIECIFYAGLNKKCSIYLLTYLIKDINLKLYIREVDFFWKKQIINQKI